MPFLLTETVARLRIISNAPRDPLQPRTSVGAQPQPGGRLHRVAPLTCDHIGHKNGGSTLPAALPFRAVYTLSHCLVQCGANFCSCLLQFVSFSMRRSFFARIFLLSLCPFAVCLKSGKCPLVSNRLNNAFIYSFQLIACPQCLQNLSGMSIAP